MREQAGEWLKGPALKAMPLCSVLADTISLELPHAKEGAPAPAAKAVPPPPPAPKDAHAPRGGDLAADAAAGVNCVASDKVSQLGSNLHHVADAEPAEEAAADGQQEAAADGQQEAEAAAEFSFEDTLLIFDWDDTILPSSWVSMQKLRLDKGHDDVTAAQRERLAEIARVTLDTIRSAKEHGQVVIITNAERGWVELTCHKFLPELAPLLECVRVVSARSSYECDVGPNPQDWKLRAFEHEIQRAYGSSTYDARRRKNVLSLGDSVHEREAVMAATAALPNCRCKSLKFTAKPDISQIHQQHTLIRESFKKIIEHDGNLDLCLRCP